MPDSLGAGLALVLFGGVFQGSFMYPSKHIKGWAWENYWLIFAATAYVACPWIIAALTVPRLAEVYSGLPPHDVESARAIVPQDAYLRSGSYIQATQFLADQHGTHAPVRDLSSTGPVAAGVTEKPGCRERKPPGLH